jgi:NADPH:quinone reductase-like Zn-dependent oxidoreductase
MKAWQLERLGGELRLTDVRMPEPRPGSVLVRIKASSLMSYLKAYVEGKLPIYNPPPGAFTIGTNAVGVVEAVGRDVWHLKAGQRVVLLSHFSARENVDDSAQILGSEQDVSDAARGPVRLSAGRSSAEVQAKRVRCSGRSIQEVRAVLVLDRAMRMAW